MKTKREQIVEQIEAYLLAVPGVSGRVFRSRETALSREEAPAFILMWDADRLAGDGVLPFTDKKLRIVVSVYQRAAKPDAAADELVQAAHAAIMADSSLGGLAIDVSDGDCELEMSDADLQACFVNMEFFVHYRHQRENLAV